MLRHFKMSEFTCKCGCGLTNVDADMLDKLDAARSLAGVPFVITSGCRCGAHNKACGGTPDSAHIATPDKPSKAVDIAFPTERRYAILRGLIEAGFERIGVNFARNFVHADTDTNKPTPRIFGY